MKKERGRPSAAPVPSAGNASIPTRRWWDNPGLRDDELMLVVRSMNAVDRAVNGFRGKRWPA
jgi:hypothetical protein